MPKDELETTDQCASDPDRKLRVTHDPPGERYAVDDLAWVHIMLSGTGAIKDVPIFIEVHISDSSMREPMKLVSHLPNGDPHSEDGHRILSALEDSLRSAADTLIAIRRETPEIL